MKGEGRQILFIPSKREGVGSSIISEKIFEIDDSVEPTSEFIKEEQEWIFKDGKERDTTDNGDLVK